MLISTETAIGSKSISGYNFYCHNSKIQTYTVLPITLLMFTITSSCDKLTAKRTSVSQLRTGLLAPPPEPPVTAECASAATFAEDTPGAALLVSVYKSTI
jgi:hypothetical protein